MSTLSDSVQHQAQGIYRLLVHRRYRTGPLPTAAARQIALQKLEHNIREAQPISLFFFWGGSKNPYLPLQSADLCEQATLRQLKRLYLEVAQVYAPGLRFYLFPGDSRLHFVNQIPLAHTVDYVQTLKAIAAAEADYFHVVPVSELYSRYAGPFTEHLQLAETQVTEAIFKQPLFEQLVHNAKKNIYPHNLHSAEALHQDCLTSARKYIVYRLAEEKARIFRDYDDCIRCSLIKFSLFFAFYQGYLSMSETQPRLDCVLHFYTGGKGNVTQPWQAVGEMQGDQVKFLSQERLQKRSLLF